MLPPDTDPDPSRAEERPSAEAEESVQASPSQPDAQRLESYGSMDFSIQSLLSGGGHLQTFRKRSVWSRRNGDGYGHRREIYEEDGLQESPFDVAVVHFTFLIGTALLLVTALASMLLMLNVVIPIPTLLPPHRSPSLLSFWLFLVSLLILLPSLFAFELHPQLHNITSALHTTNAFFLLILLTLICALQVYREGELALALPAAALAWISCAWAWAAGRICEHVRKEYRTSRPPRAFHEQEDGLQLPSGASLNPAHSRDGVPHVSIDAEREPLLGTPYIATFALPEVPFKSKIHTSLRLFLITILTTSVTAVLLMLLFDVALTGADSGFAPAEDLGTRVWIDLRAAKRQAHGEQVHGIASVGKRTSIKDFRVHIKCESSSDSTYHGQRTWQATAKKPPPKHPHPPNLRPTALVMTERGVSGVPGGAWLRALVAHARNEDSKDGDDGHLSLDSVCFWDRLGYGFSDYVEGGSADIRLHTEVLKRALEGMGAWTLPPSQQDGSAATNATLAEERYFGGPFMLVSTGYGSLFARHFAAAYPDMIQSLIYIDAETPTSWYTERVAQHSGLRAGYQAPGHRYVGLLLKDIVPALLSPLGITHLLGLLAGRGPADRILSPHYRGGSAADDLGGGGFRILGAGGSSTKLLTTSLQERLDANRGTSSRNYKTLVSTAVSDVHANQLAQKPTAVLSSFWKMHRDVEGWGDEQRLTLVKPALEQGGLVGWWRVGSRMAAPGVGGSDRGGAQGICEEPQGNIFCAEAVRKVLAAADLEEQRGRQNSSVTVSAAISKEYNWQQAMDALTFDV
ncbi:hypothetical protein K437DRAFT_274684 [Tilletiaria anomala UBC 951]|uniref:Uncharacterized protein n=1 Tax=Tilletiaria anomala (strain ATCC 24038 / CBS 436.72 / UBC 951) TaxID=1037660 RepID=A0A066VUV5_TILAU|nr:uncharacterized protein K437DRAFT_274684 [Tilletiaria anomala UBC 951]KDN44063.1 hypothetical protein K437DRAFT_274684 [Tilletiaria anomala UBC 951]